MNFFGHSRCELTVRVLVLAVAVIVLALDLLVWRP